MMTHTGRRFGWMMLTASMMAGFPAAGHAAPPATREFHLPAQDLGPALRAVGRAGGIDIMFAADLVRDRKAPALDGRFSTGEAIDRLLDGSGLIAIATDGAVLIRGRSQDATAVPQDRQPETVTVTGTRIRGAPATSPTITLSQGDIVNAGQSSVADALRAVPQNFSGGQNPGVALGASVTNQANANGTGGSAINLRGLGPDATLTLLNGHRLAYDGSFQGVDVSTIPLQALDRIEIVADGASAIYGSDAVAGVANIVLKRDYDGVATSVRIGSSTDGGDFQQQYDAVAGSRWSTGGFILTYDFERDTGIQSDQRSYTQALLAPNTLLPAQTSHGVVLSGHQDLGSLLSFSIDGLYNKRWGDSLLTLPGETSHYHTRSDSFSIAPSLKAHLGRWEAELTGAYGQNRGTSLDSEYASGTGALLSYAAACECNTLKTVELNGEGPLFALPGGDVRFAAGGGWRENIFDEPIFSSNSRTHGSRRSWYGYGEILAPLVGPDNESRFVHRLAVTGAVRYEDYADLGGIGTPKLGLIYEPVAGVSLKGSWGKSFKAPLLSQQYAAAHAYLFPARSVGGSGFPTTATALLAIGGNGDLRPERATTWTTTLDLKPVAAPGFHAAIGWFHVRYRDRIIQPVNYTSAFSNAIYDAFITRNPTSAEQQAVIARSATGLTNFAGAPYAPGNVVGIIDDYYTNVAAQTIHGIDMQADDRIGLGGGELTLSGDASWLQSRQQNSAASTPFPLAGTVFNPPRFRSRTGLVWQKGRLTASSFLNYLGGVEDDRTPPFTHGESMATVDMAIGWKATIGRGKPDNLEIRLAAQNLTNEKPPYLNSGTTYYVNYDSTNYSPIGRFLSLTVSTRW